MDKKDTNIVGTRIGLYDVLYECDFKSNDGHRMFHVKCSECGWESNVQMHRIKTLSKKCKHINLAGQYSTDKAKIIWNNKRIFKIYQGMIQRCYNPNNKYVIDTETDPLLETIPNISEASAQEIKTQSFSKLQEGFERIKTIMSPSNTKSNSAKSKETLQVIKEISSQIGEIAKYAYAMSKQPVQSKAVNYSSFGTNNHYVNTEAYS